jgi:hypothetical protein
MNEKLRLHNWPTETRRMEQETLRLLDEIALRGQTKSARLLRARDLRPPRPKFDRKPTTARRR